MRADSLRLFSFIRDNRKFPEVVQTLYSEPELMLISNSYCEQCGDCCAGKTIRAYEDGVDVCVNMEFREDGLAYCLLHCDSGEYPHGKQIPDLRDAVKTRLDPEIWAKPEACVKDGPHIKLLDRSKECPGGTKMLREYREFIKATS